MISDAWPLFGLRVTTPRLELRLPRLEDFDGLFEAVARGMHEPDYLPFNVPWSTQPEPARSRGSLQFHWRTWAEWSAAKWTLALVVFHDGVPVGQQDLVGRDFAVTRQVSSGSWLETRLQGRGLGAEMRAAVLHLAFEGLGAEWAVSAAFTDNPKSLGVSRKLGYAEDGVDVVASGDRARLQQRVRIDRAAWEAHRTVPVEVHGLDACRDMFGV
ncbi:GNAT family N-acetyltransferase [Yinghuangia seranimata]|uniref:GNAT family N-acetyltransferase n=1 Tax=Yinghuangia seranimata TaxID=408067 RepID=UPI00248D065E|nr:GNAT family N-acetyltransferase [Yinghuangia seranimata]MDI2126664.1 GNAT family N-acetyltransferase [Yinghuangia seranimata]